MSYSSLVALFRSMERSGSGPAVIQKKGLRREVWTYRKLTCVAGDVARGLRSRGVQPGDRVMIWGPDSAEWLAAFWGCVLAGAVVVPMDVQATSEFARRVISEAAVKYVIAGRNLCSQAGAASTLILEDLPGTREESGQSVSEANSNQDLGLRAVPAAVETQTREDIAQILFTSGTTGEPRGVVLTHGNLLTNVEAIERGFDPYRKYERWFHPLRFVTLVPLSHVFGQFMGLFVPLVLGAAVVFENSTKPAEIIRTIKRERATALIAVPRMLDALRGGIERTLESQAQRESFERAFAAAEGIPFLRRAWRFSRIHRRFGWRFWAVISGGAALGAETEEFFRRIGYAVVQGYGMTETSSLISLNHPFRAARGSAGKIMPNCEFRLAEDGEILVRGPSVSSGYWERGKLRKAGENGGWLRTGDLGELDAEGDLKFRGRKKNVIVTPGGLNIYPEDLESALRRQFTPGLEGVIFHDCVVVPLERGGEAEPCAVFALGSSLTAQVSDEISAAAQKAVDAANRELAEYQRMRAWVIWPESDFPRTATGKPRLALIASRLPQLLAGDDVSAGRPDDFAKLLERITGGSIPSAHLEQQLNLSSLDRVELLSAIEEQFQVELNETAFAEANTVADIERLIRQPAARSSEYSYPRWAQLAPVRWLRLAVYYALVWPATQILGDPRVQGRQNLRGLRGPALFVSNHITRRADIGLILAALPVRFRHRLAIAMGGETLLQMCHPPRNWIFLKRWSYQLSYWLVTALFHVFPLPQRSGFRESFRYAGEAADRGYCILVFPEGEVSNDGTMAPFQSGIGLLSEDLRLPVVPIRLDGVWGMKREGRRWAHRGELCVRIGVPVSFPPGTPAAEIASNLERRVREL